ncbi:MAG: Ig-like domain-containing protein [Oscillospiraceae bacterium]|nr:Ig-like domain-containing protein [Oscillospiraceae bacterium]
MNKIFKSLLSVFLAVFMVVSLTAIPSSAAASLSKTSISLTKGYQTTLSVSGASGSVTWSTGDKSIATVSSTGKVVGKGIGTTYVYAQTGSTTLKCKVTVIAAKITASSSSVSFDRAGESKTVTVTVKGSHSNLSVGSTNKSVASASWVRPVKWDGDKIKLNVTAKGNGTARIKVYLKNYSSTCYKYIDVNVGDYPVDDDVDDGSDSNTVIMPYTDKVEVSSGNTYTLQVYSTNQNNLDYSISDSKVAAVTAGTTTNNYRNYTIKGISEGTATLKIYDKTNTKKYSDIKITVTNGAAYYEIYTAQPAKLVSTDLIIKVPVNGTTTYYMLVPASYDPAYTNTLFAEKLNKYSYYEVYSSVPARSASNDTYKSFNHENRKYTYGARYILLPANYDEVKYNTAVAKYNERYEYYTIYNENPAKQDSWDEVKTWTVNDASTGATVRRYILLPYGYDTERADKIMDDDKGSSSAYTYYVPYSKMPTVDASKDTVIFYDMVKDDVFTTKYMVVPANSGMAEIIKANDAIQADTGVFEYNVMYSQKKPVAGDGERVVSGKVGSLNVYVLYSISKYGNDDDAAFNAARNNYADGYKN